MTVAMRMRGAFAQLMKQKGIMGDLADKSLSHTESAKPIAQTLVFFDVESTGLPFSVGKRNVQITELSLIAVDRTEFENNENIRILNKLNLTVKPRSGISLEAIHMTGLCNTSLQFQEHFNPSTAQLLQLFCERLNQPVCLLAHNGRRFDFPVLQAELKNVGAKLSDTIFCADTIEAFREILPRQDADITINSTAVASPETTLLSPKGFKEKLTPAVDTYHTIKSSTQYYDVDTLTNDCIDELLCQEMEIFQDLISKDDPVDLFSNVSLLSSTNGDSKHRGFDMLCACTDDLLCLHTSSSQECEKTPHTKTASIPMRAVECKVSVLEQTTPDKKEKNHSSVRRKLFIEGAVEDGTPVHKTPEKKSKMSFSLQNLYRHFFQHDIPLAHFAEGDCIALMKISRELKGFLPWVDEHMILFNNVRPLW